MSSSTNVTLAAGSAIPVKMPVKYSLPRICWAAFIGLVFILKMTAELTFIAITLLCHKPLLSPQMLVTLLDLALSSCGFYLFVLHACCDNRGYISGGTTREVGHVAAIVVLDALCCRYNIHSSFTITRLAFKLPLYGVLAAIGYCSLRVNDTAILISHMRPAPPVAPQSQADPTPSTTKHSEDIIFTNPFQSQDHEGVTIPPTIPQHSGPFFAPPSQHILSDAPPAYLYPTFTAQGPTVCTDAKA